MRTFQSYILDNCIVRSFALLPAATKPRQAIQTSHIYIYISINTYWLCPTHYRSIYRPYILNDFACVFFELAQLLPPRSFPVARVVAQICINMLALVRLFADLPALEHAKCCFTGTHTGSCLPALCRK